METWKSVVMRKDFWIDYFRLMGEEREVKPYQGLKDTIKFPILKDCGFVLDLTQDLSDYSLSLYHPSIPYRNELAYISEGWWHPVLFRWEELEIIEDFLAKQHDDLPSSVPFLLFSIFAPVTIHDDLDRVHYKARSAWQSLGLFTEEEIDKALQFYTPFEGIEWIKHPDYGWVATGDGAYSRRVAGDQHFPFQIFNQIMDHIIRGS